MFSYIEAGILFSGILQSLSKTFELISQQGRLYSPDVGILSGYRTRPATLVPCPPSLTSSYKLVSFV